MLPGTWYRSFFFRSSIFFHLLIRSKTIAGLESERERLAAELAETAATLEGQLSEARGVSKAREEDLEAASQDLEAAQVFFFVARFSLAPTFTPSKFTFKTSWNQSLGRFFFLQQQ